MRIFIETNERLVSTGLLLIRVVLGVVFFAHGAQKVLGMFGGHGLMATATTMGKMTAIPDWLFYIASFAELLGGIGMLLGLLTRFWGLALLIDMSVAVLTVHAPHGFFLPMGFEYPASLGIIAFAILIAGPGLFSLDHVLFSGSAITKRDRKTNFPVPGGTAAFRA